MTASPEVMIAPAIIFSPSFLANESDSPVINASEISKLFEEIKIPSQGTWSPSFNFNKSPLTIFSANTEVSVLSLFMRTTRRAVNICNFSKSIRA